MRAAKKDENHNEIAQFLEKKGFTVLDTSKLGDGFPDMAISYTMPRSFKKFAALLEAKMPGEKLNPKQEKVRQRWQGYYVVATNGQEAYEDLCLCMLGLNPNADTDGELP